MPVESDKPCGIGEYVVYKNCVCRNGIVDKLVQECNNVTDENKIYDETLNANSSDDCAFLTLLLCYLQNF